MAHPLLFLALGAVSGTQVQFTDATNAAGVSYRQLVETSVSFQDMAAMTGGAAAGDYDGDGWVDLFVCIMDRPSRLFRNLGEVGGVHQGFEEVSESAFLPLPPQARINGATWADVDGDGDLDLHMTALPTERYFLWINNGQGQFTEEGIVRGAAQDTGELHLGFSSAFGDYDRDGYLDLYVAEWGNSNIGAGPPHSRRRRKRGAAAPGYFEDVTDAAQVSIDDSAPTAPSGTWSGVYAFTPRFSDLDDDGWPDLAIAGDFLTSRLFWNDGDGTFTDGTITSGVGTDENGMGATTADLNGDGHLDWFVTSIYDPQDPCNTIGGCNWGGSGNRLFLGDGNRGFTDGTDAQGVRDGGWGWGAVHLDYDNDGRLDLAMTNGIVWRGTNFEDRFNHDATKLWRGTANGFVDVGTSVGIVDRRSGKGLLTLDYDRDGDTDLFVTNAGHLPCLYRNDGGNDAHWLQVELRGANANTFGVGARVKLWPVAGAAPQVREVSASSNYLSQCENLLQFGLGAHTTVHSLEIRWPSGQMTVLNDLAADQRILVVEP